MWSFFASLILGLLIGFRVPLSKKALHWAGTGTTAGLMLLLFTMGVKIGMDQEVFDNLRTIGVRAGFLALAAVAGSLLLLFLWERRSPLGLMEEADQG